MELYESKTIPSISLNQWESIFDTLEVPMMLLDDENTIIRINNSMRSMVNKNENLIGEKCYRIVHGTSEPPENCPHLKTIEYHIKQVETIEIPELNSFLRVTTSPTYDLEGNLLGSAHVAKDITDLISAKNELKNTLDLKELLMREVHHRVKNNLVNIASLLYLQALNTNDPDAKDILMDAQRRAKSMAIMHRKIYTYNEFEKIELKYYFQELLDELLISYPNDELQYFLDVQDIYIDVDTALILGLIMNELVSNSLKYAFSDDQKRIIQILFKKIDNQYVLQVSDNGKSRSRKIDFDDQDIVNSKSFGITMVKLFTKQLDGQFSVEYRDGTIITINFNEYNFNSDS